MPTSKYTKSKVKEAISKSKSWADVCRHFGVKPSTGGQTHVTKRAKEYGLDFSHFIGQGWRKGQTFKREWVPAKKYLKKGSIIHSHGLKLKLFREKIKEQKCERCGLTHWQGEPSVLELDHINGDHSDNRLLNLMILCPNCHSLKTREQRRSKRSLVAKRFTQQF